MLCHEKLDVYGVGLEFLEYAQKLARFLPRTKGQLGDQLLRASESIVLRIAEAAGLKAGSADRLRHYRAARGSAMECSAVLDICRIRRIDSPENLSGGRELLIRIVQMLTKLSRKR